MIHAQGLHRHMAPHDLPNHIVEHHRQTVADVVASMTPTRVNNYLHNHGIESTGDQKLDALLAYHEKAHTYGESRTTETRRAEQRSR